MTEVPPEAYKAEYYYQARLQQQAEQFEELLSRFSAEDEEVKAFLEEAYNKARAVDPSLILNPNKLKAVKKEKPALFEKISPVYEEFLKEKAGLL